MTSAASTNREPGLHLSVDEITGTAWDRVVAEFDDATIDQTWTYAAVCWGASHLSTAVLRRGRTVVGACLLVLARPPLFSGGVAIAKFGPLWRANGELEPGNLHLLLDGLIEEYVERRGLFLRFVPPASAEHSEPIETALRARGFAGHAAEDSERYMVAVSEATDRLRAGLKSKWRYHLKRSEKHGLNVDSGTEGDRVEVYLELYAAMRARKSFEDARATYRLPDICSRLPSGLKPVVWLCYEGTTPVGGAVVSRLGDTALYLFGATNDRGRELRAGYLMQWAIAERLGREGCKWYDLGGTEGDAGLLQFKSGFVGKHGKTPQLPGHFDRAPGPVTALAARVVFGLKDYRDVARERLAELSERWGSS